MNYLLFGPAAVLLCGICLPALASTQDTGGSETSDTFTTITEGDIVVTARRRDESLLDVPVAVTVLSGDTLEKRRIDNVEALRFVAPALQVTPTSFGKAVPGYTFRSQRSLESIINQDPASRYLFCRSRYPAPPRYERRAV